MAIAVDATSTGHDDNPGTTCTVSHTCTGSDLILIIGIGVYSASDLVSAVTYNGDAATLMKKQVAGGGTAGYTYLFYLVNPDTGTHDIVVTTSSGATKAVCSASYTGAKQTGIPDASGSTTSADALQTTKTTTITTVLDNCWTVMAVGDLSNSTAPVAGAGTTRRVFETSYGIGLFDSNAAITPAGSTSLTSTSSGDNITQSMASFPPVVASGPANLKTFNGLASASVKTIDGLAIASVKSINGLT